MKIIQYVSSLAIVFSFILLLGCKKDGTPDYLNPELDVDQRVDDLIARMTIHEKISQMSHLAPGIERLGIVPYEPNFENPLMFDDHPDYDTKQLKKEMNIRSWENYAFWNDGSCLDGGWWNEALHGVARAGLATAFPQNIGMGCTWNSDLVQQAMAIASTEARVHHNVYGKKLTYWSPTINILRDPRWGRNEESFSEDPYLLSQMAVAYVKGFQGDDPKYLKAISTVKHFVANNSEYNRHDGSSNISERWLREYYMPAFRAAIEEGNAYSVMSAYNAVNGIPVSADPRLMTQVLRDEWGFEGFVVSDCGAVSDVPNRHKYETDPEKAVALIVKAGLDLECETCESEQFMFDKYLLKAYEKGYITEIEIDIAVRRLFRARMKLGEFDPPQMVPFNNITRDDLDSKDSRKLALQAARESLVLLKNKNNFLPIDRDQVKTIAVIGPNADRLELGGYSGSPSVQVDPLIGLKQFLGDDVEIIYVKGCEISDRVEVGWDEENDRPIYDNLDEWRTIHKAAEVAAKVDIVILFLGTNLDIANEAADRTNLELPGNQLKLAQSVYKANPKTVAVLINGMPLSINWLDDNVPAILEAWYAGQSQGTAIAEVLFGDYNPGGKLSVTFFKGVDDFAPLSDYDITKGRTYWFYEGDVLYPFGYGLSYTSFDYGNLQVNVEKYEFSFDVKNTGELKGDEVIQLYVKDVESSVLQPEKKLRDFLRVSLDPGETKRLSFTLDEEDFLYWDEKIKGWSLEPGEFEIQIGASSADIKLSKKIEIK